jgi:Helix-turn-helix domain
MEQHEPQFRGVWCPPEVFALVTRRLISHSEGWLLLIVDSFVKHTGKDCFASNTYLAKIMGMEKRQVTSLITHLKKEGLLLQTGFDGRRRLLCTCWSRPHLNRSTVGQLPLRRAENCTSESQKTATYKDNNNVDDKKVGARGARGERKPKTAAPEWYTVVAKKLHSVMYGGSPNAVVSTPRESDRDIIKKWEDCFRTLSKVVEIPRIQEVVEWYCKEYPLQGDNKYFPRAQNAYLFCEKFRIIEDYMDRQQVERGERPARSENPYEVVHLDKELTEEDLLEEFGI